MIIEQVSKMIDLSVELKKAILQDIEDVKNAEHEKLLQRNENKLSLMQNISDSHEQLNVILSNAIQNGEDVNEYRDIVNMIEKHL